MVYEDTNGQIGTHSFDTTIANTNPTVAAPSLSNPVQGTKHQFSFTIPTDADGTVTHFVVEFGDGEEQTFQTSDFSGQTVTATHTYSESGNFDVVATAYDNSGGVTSQTVAVSVGDEMVTLEKGYTYNLVALIGFFLLGTILSGTAFKMQQGEIAGDEEMNERDRQRLESVERRMESISEREELMEVSAYDASRAATKLEEHIAAFNSILVKAQEIAAEDKLKELEAAEEARQKKDEEMQLDLEDPDIEMVAERFHESLSRLVAARDDLSKIEKHLARILKMERDEQLEKLTEMTESYETTKRKIDALESSKDARDAAAVENNIMNMLSAAASGGSMNDADFGDFGDFGGDDDEYEVEIYEDEDGSFYYIDPDTGEEVPCDEDGNAL
jgi:ribosomal protein L29